MDNDNPAQASMLLFTAMAGTHDADVACALAGSTPRRRVAARLLGVGFSLVAMCAACWVSPAIAAAEELPPVKVTYHGALSYVQFPTEHSPFMDAKSLTWTAKGSSGGATGELPLEYLNLAGEETGSGSGATCEGWNAVFSLNRHLNPYANGWLLSTDSQYPFAGWKYQVSGLPGSVPGIGTYTYGDSCGEEVKEQPLSPLEMLTRQETLNETQSRELGALSEVFEAEPGQPTSQTREFHFDGISHCACFPDPTEINETLTLTVTVTSPAANNSIPTPSSPSSPSPGATTGNSPPPAPCNASEYDPDLEADAKNLMKDMLDPLPPPSEGHVPRIHIKYDNSPVMADDLLDLPRDDAVFPGRCSLSGTPVPPVVSNTVDVDETVQATHLAGKADASSIKPITIATLTGSAVPGQSTTTRWDFSAAGRRLLSHEHSALAVRAVLRVAQAGNVSTVDATTRVPARKRVK